MANTLEAETTAKGLKIKVVGVRQSLGHVHVVAAAQVYRGVLGDDPLFQGSQRNRDLNGRTRLGAAGKGKLLIDHGQDAAIAGVDGYHGAIHVAQRIDRRLAHHGIFSRSHIALGDVRVSKRAGGEMLVRTVAHQNRAADMPGSSANRDHRAQYDRVGVPQLRHVPASMRALLYMGDVGAMGRVRGTRMGRFRESSGGQTKDQYKMSDASKKLSVHRVLSSRNHGISKMIRARKAGYSSNPLPQSRIPRKDPRFPVANLTLLNPTLP